MLTGIPEPPLAVLFFVLKASKERAGHRLRRYDRAKTSGLWPMARLAIPVRRRPELPVSWMEINLGGEFKRRLKDSSWHSQQ
jgi:hypothetical protein